MDNQNTVWVTICSDGICVLILVLMDNQNTGSNLFAGKDSKSLNPCSNG